MILPSFSFLEIEGEKKKRKKKPWCAWKAHQCRSVFFFLAKFRYFLTNKLGKFRFFFFSSVNSTNLPFFFGHNLPTQTILRHKTDFVEKFVPKSSDFKD